MDYTKIKQWLKDNLNEEKYYHSLETAENALKISNIINFEDKDKAYLSALIHDCAKCIEKDKMFEIASILDFVTEEELSMPKTLHAPVGVEVAKKEFFIADEEILSAIRFHTVARKNMTKLEMIVFLSDKIREEFGTKYFGKDAFDFIKEYGIETAMLKAIQNGIAYLHEKNAKPCSLTLEALEYFKDKISNCI